MFLYNHGTGHKIQLICIMYVYNHGTGHKIS